MMIGDLIGFTSKVTGDFYIGTVYLYSQEKEILGIDSVSRANAFGRRELVEGCCQFSLHDIKDLGVITHAEKDGQKNNPCDASSSTVSSSKWLSDVKNLQAITKSQEVHGSLSYHSFSHEDGPLVLEMNSVLLPFQIASHPQNAIQAVKTRVVDLPEEIKSEIFAYLPKQKYPILSCASKTFAAMVHSREIEEVRRRLGKDSIFLCYMSLSGLHWFTLRVDNENPTEDVFAETVVPIPNDQTLQDVFAVGREIVMVFGTRFRPVSVWIYDTLSCSVREAPTMPAVISNRNAGVVHNKLYVFGGVIQPTKNNLTHVMTFDFGSQSWTGPVRSSMGYTDSTTTVTMDKNIYGIKEYHDLYEYNIRDDTYIRIEASGGYTNGRWSSNSVCVMENTLYFHDTDRGLFWYDSTIPLWKRVLGFRLREVEDDYDVWWKWELGIRVAIREYYGNLAILWKDDDGKDYHMKSESSDKMKKVFCCMTSLRRFGTDIHAEVGPIKVIGTLPSDYFLQDSVSVIG